MLSFGRMYMKLASYVHKRLNIYSTRFQNLKGCAVCQKRVMAYKRYTEHFTYDDRFDGSPSRCHLYTDQRRTTSLQNKINYYVPLLRIPTLVN